MQWQHARTSHLLLSPSLYPSLSTFPSIEGGSPSLSSAPLCQIPLKVRWQILFHTVLIVKVKKTVKNGQQMSQKISGTVFLVHRVQCNIPLPCLQSAYHHSTACALRIIRRVTDGSFQRVTCTATDNQNRTTKWQNMERTQNNWLQSKWP